MFLKLLNDDAIFFYDDYVLMFDILMIVVFLIF